MPDAQPSFTPSERERLSILENDMKWVKRTTDKNTAVTNKKLDEAIALLTGLPESLKKEIKQDLSEEFERRFVPKRALFIAMGAMLTAGIFLGGSASHLLKLIAL